MAPNSATGSLLRDEFLNGEIFSTFKEAQIVIEAWRPPSLAERPPMPY